MGRYFNKTRGMLPVTLHSGAPMSIPGKQWVTIPSAEENSSSIANAIKRGFLARATVDDTATEPEPVAAPVKDPAPEEVQKITAPKPAIAKIGAVVQNQTPKSESAPKAAKPSKADMPDAENLIDEPKRKRE